MEKYKETPNTQKMNDQVIIDNIIEELDKKGYSYKQKEKSFVKR
ncbi:MAG TPA: hypothetical protein VF222_10135 [Nitrososphaeraceae archaeon]